MTTNTTEQNDLLKLPIKKRAQLYADATFARNRPYLPPILTPDQRSDLYYSFQNDAGLKALEQYSRLAGNFIVFFNYLDGLYLQFLAEIYQINGYILLRDSYTREERMLTRIMNTIPDNETRAKVLDIILESPQLMGSTEAYSDNFKQIDGSDVLKMKRAGRSIAVKIATHGTDEDQKAGVYRLRYLIGGWSYRACNTLASAKATMEAFKIAMKQTGVQLKSVKLAIKHAEEKFKANLAVFPELAKERIEYQLPGQTTALNLPIFPTLTTVEMDMQEAADIANQLKQGFDE